MSLVGVLTCTTIFVNTSVFGKIEDAHAVGSSSSTPRGVCVCARVHAHTPLCVYSVFIIYNVSFIQVFMGLFLGALFF